jgi:hypothetical protein
LLLWEVVAVKKYYNSTIVNDEDQKIMHRTQVNHEKKATYKSAMTQLEGDNTEMSLLT